MIVINFMKGLRNHWKKSTFAACAVSYGLSYINDNQKISHLMRTYCEEAANYGDSTIDAQLDPKRILVILNPAANKKSAEKKFEKYCEPILHLAGYLIEVVQTDSVGHARRYIESLEKIPDAILIAGGDGTVSEAVTGLLRRSNKNIQCPIGILPVGRTNATLLKYFNLPGNPDKVEKVREYASSAIAIVRGKTERKDIMKVQVLPKENIEHESDEKSLKPIYAMHSLQWGAFKDAENLRDKYWYLGPLREYASTLFNAFRAEKLTWHCNAVLKYTPPCKGCSNCYVKEEEKSVGSSRWWSRFVPKFKLGQQSDLKSIDYSKITNENCSIETVVEIKPTELILGLNSEEQSKLKVNITESIDSGLDFIKENWRRLKTGETNTVDLFEGRTIEVIPDHISTDAFYFIDNEPYEVRAVKISVVPSAVNVFVP